MAREPIYILYSGSARDKIKAGSPFLLPGQSALLPELAFKKINLQ